MKIHDISILIDENMIIYPGDKGVNINWVKRIPENKWNLTEICMGSHTGTHADAKLHVKNNTMNIDDIPLEKCYGICKVLDLSEIPFGKGITYDNLKDFQINRSDIILLKTKNSTIDTKEFNPKFVYLEESGADYLVKKKIKSFGFDDLSIGSKEVHEKLLLNDIIVFENLDLRNIEPKQYIFVGLPLKIRTEGSPARVILIEE